MLVTDASPLIVFSRSKHLDILQKVTKILLIPEAVYQEVVVKGKGKPGSRKVKSASWIKREEIKSKSKLVTLSDRLGLGEKESIILAEEKQLPLITDDSLARREARKLNLKLVSSLNILQEAKARGIISEVKNPLENFINVGFYITSDIYKETLRKAGET